MSQQFKPCLIVFFNHRYEANVEKLEAMYAPRFSERFYLMPFWEDYSNRVIRVYGSCRYFHSLFHQALPYYYHESFSHYVFVADDLILNPSVNESNIVSLFGVGEHGGYIKNYWHLHDISFPWAHLPDILTTLRNPEAEAYSELPSYDAALEHFKRHGIDLGDCMMRMGTKRMLLDNIEEISKKVNFLMEHYQRGEEKLPYPAVGAYSDLVIVPARAIKQFCHYCGVFDAMGLFVEASIPTSLLFSCEQVTFEREDFKGVEFWNLAGYQELSKLHAETGGKVRGVFERFPAASYIHPLKLSWWNV